MSIITFIIPTIGRDTLQRSIQSLIDQTNPNWNAIVVFDGIEPNIICDDARVNIMQCNKLGENHENMNNSAGNVRNYAVPFLETEWIGFLDDDDTLAPDYIETLCSEFSTYPELDVLIFRMKHNQYGIIPSLDNRNITWSNVGISFSLKAKIMKQDGILFTPSHTEDFDFLNRIRENSYKIIIHPLVKYFVRDTPHPIEEEGVRSTINF